MLPAGATIPERKLPEGYVVRAAEPGEVRAAHDVLEEAFLEWSVREREDFEDFEAATTARPGFEPWNLRVVVDGGGTVRGPRPLRAGRHGDRPHLGQPWDRRGNDQGNRTLKGGLQKIPLICGGLDTSSTGRNINS
ncbi:MAG: family N-acetyltransferase [Nocardioides sp.]|nr:family N-acetyltransferase [Nocardioides sp.]